MREKFSKLEFDTTKSALHWQSSNSGPAGGIGQPTSADFVVLNSDFENFSLKRSSLVKKQNYPKLSTEYVMGKSTKSLNRQFSTMAKFLSQNLLGHPVSCDK